MAFLIFERVIENGSPILRPTGESFSLAGYNLIYQAWEKHGRPIDQGWHVTADELIQLQSKEQYAHDVRRLVIDFDPKANKS